MYLLSLIFDLSILMSFLICTRTLFTPLALIHAFGAFKLLFVLIMSLNYACLLFTGHSIEET